MSGTQRNQKPEVLQSPEAAKRFLDDCIAELREGQLTGDSRKNFLDHCKETINLKANASIIDSGQRELYKQAARTAEPRAREERSLSKELERFDKSWASYQDKDGKTVTVTGRQLREGDGSLIVGATGPLVREVKELLIEAGIIGREAHLRKNHPDVYDIGTSDKIKERIQSTADFKAANPNIPANGQFDKATLDAITAK